VIGRQPFLRNGLRAQEQPLRLHGFAQVLQHEGEVSKVQRHFRMVWAEYLRIKLQVVLQP
jgi:hypothetical protein